MQRKLFACFDITKLVTLLLGSMHYAVISCWWNAQVCLVCTNEIHFPFYVKDSASSTSLQLGVCYDAFFQLSIALGPIFFQHTDRDISSVDLLWSD